jgi:hypothetical protein
VEPLSKKGVHEMNKQQRRAFVNLLLFTLSCAVIGSVVEKLVGRLTPAFLVQAGIVTASALLMYWLGCRTWLR